jgi:hypothetical protein
MKLIRRLSMLAVLAVATFGILSTTTRAATTVAPDQATVGSQAPSSGYCWMYFMGRWIAIPC